MIYQVNGFIVRKTWGFHKNPKPKHGAIIGTKDKVQGTLCYMSGESEEEVKEKVGTQYPDFTIQSIKLMSDEQILAMLKRQQIAQ
jgi:hypothetical protein